MSDTNLNGQDQQAAAPSLIINAQYLRDLSFENPRAPDSLFAQTAAPEVSIDVDLKARQLNPELYETVLHIRVEARQGTEIGFVVEVDYGAAVTVKNAPPDMIGPLLLIETPRLLFPFARAIVAEATREGGFPPLLINPIDFVELYRRKAAEQQQVQPPANA